MMSCSQVSDVLCPLFVLVFPRKSRSEHGCITRAGTQYKNEDYPYCALALVWAHLHASRVLWMPYRFVMNMKAIFAVINTIQAIEKITKSV